MFRLFLFGIAVLAYLRCGLDVLAASPARVTLKHGMTRRGLVFAVSALAGCGSGAAAVAVQDVSDAPDAVADVDPCDHLLDALQPPRLLPGFDEGKAELEQGCQADIHVSTLFEAQCPDGTRALATASQLGDFQAWFFDAAGVQVGYLLNGDTVAFPACLGDRYGLVPPCPALDGILPLVGGVSNKPPVATPLCVTTTVTP